MSNLTRALTAWAVLRHALAGRLQQGQEPKSRRCWCRWSIASRSRSVWHVKIGGEKPMLRLGLDAAVDGDRVFACQLQGQRRRPMTWRAASSSGSTRCTLPLSAGPGAADGLVIVGGSKGDVIALSEQDGAQRWRVRINAEILSAPAVGNGLVVVRAVDGRLHGLSAKDGSENWVVDQQVPRLSLRGTSRPIIAVTWPSAASTTAASWRSLASNGSTAWEAAVGQSARQHRAAATDRCRCAGGCRRR